MINRPPTTPKPVKDAKPLASLRTSQQQSPAGGLPEVERAQLAFSSHAVYTVATDTITISGWGFGHGVGMCRFGAQHMARVGNRHDKILGFYYPGARIQKAY
ncbi:MAG: hypothetical protein AAGI37_10685 [Planctomycetota bacterium]